VELTGIEFENGNWTKLRAHAVLAENSRKSLGKLLPFGPVGSRLVPRNGAELRQPDGNQRNGAFCAARSRRSAPMLPGGRVARAMEDRHYSDLFDMHYVVDDERKPVV
jgi:hypothetical protein